MHLMNFNQELPLVSIIAICYNQAKYAIETLDSILSQTYPNIQLIIIDDCSTDNSVEVIEKWIEEKKVVCEFVRHAENWGVTRTCNDGLRRVKGKYYQVIACDDVLKSYKIERQVIIFEKNDALALLYSDVNLIDQNSKRVKKSFLMQNRHFPDMPQGKVFTELLINNFIPAPSLLIRYSVINYVGAYDENLPYEDYDMLLRICRDNSIGYMHETLVKYRILNGQLSEESINDGKKLLTRSIARMKHVGIKATWDRMILKELVSSIDKAMNLNRDFSLKILAYSKRYFYGFRLFSREILLKSGLPMVIVAKISFKLRKFDLLFKIENTN